MHADKEPPTNTQDVPFEVDPIEDDLVLERDPARNLTLRLAVSRSRLLGLEVPRAVRDGREGAEREGLGGREVRDALRQLLVQALRRTRSQLKSFWADGEEMGFTWRTSRSA